MYSNQLHHLGLTLHQANVYQTLLSSGGAKASRLSSKTGIARGVLYKTLDELMEMDLVSRIDPVGEVSQYFAKHPSNLEKRISQEEIRIREMQTALDGILPSMTSEFNLMSGKPGVRFFEGKEGIERVLEDSLRIGIDEIIYTYADIEAVNKNIKTINEEYVKKREKLKLKKKALILDTAFAREYMRTYHTIITDTRLIKAVDAKPFQSVMEIYSGKVSYITFEKDRMIGVIIEDKAIYEMHRYIFESQWEGAERVGKKIEF